MSIDYSDTQTYIQHFHEKHCDLNIVNNTEGIFNLCFYLLSEVDRLALEIEKKTINIVRLKEIIFGMKNVDDCASDESNAPSQPLQKQPKEPVEDTHHQTENDKENSKPKPKGHGRLSADAYTGATHVVCTCDYHEGDICPQCNYGQLKRINPKTKIHIDGQSPLFATRFELEQLACSFCPWTTTATAPVDTSEKYTARSKATLAYLHYLMGLPFYRLAKMQQMMGVPLPVSTQSDLMASMMGPIHCIFNRLVWVLAQSDCLYMDDTGIKIQSLIKENKSLNPDRKGMFGSGFIGESEQTVVLFFASRLHAGENFEKILSLRDPEQGKMTRMADALAANGLGDPSKTNNAKCNSHVVRRFKPLVNTYPEETQFVLSTYGQVYDHDEYCKNKQLTDQARLAYHQTHSKPLMDLMKMWIELQLTKVEPNGVLASEYQYIVNHWTELTLFLRVAGAPLDNNRMEAMLKYLICYRKNSLLFQTSYSAEYGSRQLSLMVTCMINGINAIDYVTQLQCYESFVWADPDAWLPWRYQQTLKRMSIQQAV